MVYPTQASLASATLQGNFQLIETGYGKQNVDRSDNEAGADPNLVYYGCNPLHSAAYGGNVEIINLLLQAGANPDATHMFDYHVHEDPVECCYGLSWLGKY
ncbi:hypothetical protein OROGR_007073 [Orobanche gracilis]